MMVISCPCCGEKYYSEDDFIEQQRFFCEKCNKKFVFINGRFVPYVIEKLTTADEYIGACPFCEQKYNFDFDIKGEFFCTACQKSFYIASGAENHVNPVTENTKVIHGTAALDAAKAKETESAAAEKNPSEVEAAAIVPVPVVEPAEAVKPIAVQEEVAVQPPPAAPVAAVQEEPVAPVAPPAAPEMKVQLEQKINDEASSLVCYEKEVEEEVIPDMSEYKHIKVGQSRAKSGISGFFINIAEKICRN